MKRSTARGCVKVGGCVDVKRESNEMCQSGRVAILARGSLVVGAYVLREEGVDMCLEQFDRVC